MTQEDKDLLLRDLCCRLLYGVRMFEIESINDIQSHLTLYSITNKESVICITPSGGIVGSSIDAFKPYLFPLSSMTEEQKKEYRKVCELDTEILSKHPMDGSPFPAMYNSQGWLDAHHFDYRGLIPMGLAIDATNLNIY